MKPEVVNAELIYEYDAHLGEGPVWDEREQKLFWIDILSGKILLYNPKSGNNISFNVGEHIGCLALREQGGLVIAHKGGFAFFDLESEETIHIVNPKSNQSDSKRFNDGKCDSQGRLWAGNMAYDLSPGEGNLYCLRPDLSLDKKLTDLDLPNGLDWNSDKKVFYFIDTLKQTVYAFKYNARTGNIADRSIVVEVDKGQGFPDGMTIDSEGFLWVALYDGGKVIRIDPNSGEIVFEVHLPVSKVTSCTFGGSNLDELYITTCRENMSSLEVQETPLSGSLFGIKLPHRGLIANRFRG